MVNYWSWLLTAVGLTCFWLAGRKVWWAWYVGIAGQALWLAYSLGTRQWGFLVGVVAYSWVYVGNAIRWTREHRADDGDLRAALSGSEADTSDTQSTDQEDQS